MFFLWSATYDEGGYWDCEATANEGDTVIAEATERVAGGPKKGTHRITERLRKKVEAEARAIIAAAKAAQEVE
jgi:hypothetical protein